jgi:hypothetical protein
MKFFFPDSQDLVDPSFDFVTEQRSSKRLRHRDDVYAHEVFSSPVADGVLISKGIVDGVGGKSGRYTLAQRQRFLRVGAREFLRIESIPRASFPVMGDCGAFTYVKEDVPPFTADDVIEFYVQGDFDYGISVDHVILAYQPDWDETGEVPEDVKYRQEITFELASNFLSSHKRQKLLFKPLGVAQGWSPKSYTSAVKKLQKMGYTYIALGGMVPLKTNEIIETLQSIAQIRKTSTKLHLLGVTRTEQVAVFSSHGVVSFDSTSPLRRAFKDDKDNYYTMDRTYTAIRVPQVEGNPSLQKRIRSGSICQETARRLETRCLKALSLYNEGDCSVDDVVCSLREYEELYDPKHDHTEVYREILLDKPWEKCGCDICRAIGYHVVLFRGAERNRRRGFHNVWVFNKRLKRELQKNE